MSDWLRVWRKNCLIETQAKHFFLSLHLIRSIGKLRWKRNATHELVKICQVKFLGHETIIMQIEFKCTRSRTLYPLKLTCQRPIYAVRLFSFLFCSFAGWFSHTHPLQRLSLSFIYWLGSDVCIWFFHTVSVIRAEFPLIFDETNDYEKWKSLFIIYTSNF